jgi:hypothetical protein
MTVGTRIMPYSQPSNIGIDVCKFLFRSSAVMTSFYALHVKKHQGATPYVVSHARETAPSGIVLVSSRDNDVPVVTEPKKGPVDVTLLAVRSLWMKPICICNCHGVAWPLMLCHPGTLNCSRASQTVVIWVVTQCSLVGRYRPASIFSGHFNPEDGGSMLLRNVCYCLQYCTVSQPRRPQSKFYTFRKITALSLETKWSSKYQYQFHSI